MRCYQGVMPSDFSKLSEACSDPISICHGLTQLWSSNFGHYMLSLQASTKFPLAPLRLFLFLHLGWRACSKGRHTAWASNKLQQHLRGCYGAQVPDRESKVCHLE